MPELPEVETIRTMLSKQIRNVKIVSVNVCNSRTIENIDKDLFVHGVTGSTVESISRRGKYFLFNLSSGTMVLHLRMDGQLYVDEYPQLTSSHTLIVFNLEDGRALHFDDQRRFAKAAFIPLGVEDEISGVSKLGLEPFDENLTADYLKRRWCTKTCSVKEALMDQSVVAGFGNFYSDDLLFLCGIYPKKRCINLSNKNYADLVRTMPELMTRAIMINNVTEDEYSKIRGHGFKARELSYVYGRAGNLCKSCGSVIRSMKLGGRTCSYCPSCQHTVKILKDEITPDVLLDVAKFIGSYIQLWGEYRADIVASTSETFEPSSMTWEEYVMFVYKDIMSEDAISVSDQRFGEWRKYKALAIANDNSNSSFEVGVKWLKSQRWRE